MAEIPAFDPRQPFEEVAAPKFDPSKPFTTVGPSGPDIGQPRAAIEGLKSGVTANFSDEIAGLHNARVLSPVEKLLISRLPENLQMAVRTALLPITGPVDIASGGARVLAEKITGRPSSLPGEQPGSAMHAYETGRDVVRADQKAAQEQHPKTFMAGQVGGAVALPVGRMAQAATLPARIGRGAATGAGFGGASGFGEGEGLADSTVKGLTGGAIGTLIGGAGPPVVEGALQVGRALTRPATSAIRGAVNPEGEAARRVVGAIERDIANDPNAATRLTPQEFAVGRQSGGPVAVMDMGGETTRALGRSAANTSPEGRAALNTTINDRFEEQSGRVSDWLRQTFHYPNAHATQEAIDQTARTTNRGNYARAYRDGSNGVWSPELERLAGSDAVSAAMQAASRNARDEAIVGGYGAMNPRITFTPDGRMQFNRGPTGVPTYPDLQFWDLTRRELSDAARRAGPGTSEARRLNNFATAMNNELDQLVPSYRQARAGAAHFFGAENSLEAGQNFVGSAQRFGIPETRAAIGRMSPTERQLFQDGYVSRLVERLDATGDRRNVLNQIAQSPAAREELVIALGRQRAAQFEAGMRVEGIMDLARGAVQGNSTTARQLAELGFAGGAGTVGAFGTYNLDPVQMTTAALAGAFLAGRRGIDQRVARHVAELLVSDDPARLRQGLQIVARNENLMNSLRTADQRLARVGGQQSTTAPAIQGSVPPRAEDEKP